MNERSRTENSSINFMFSIGTQIITLLVSFFSRTVFIKILGSDYLGINGLFSNILSILSLVELGIGASISFSLYKPIAENDYEKIAQLSNFFKKTYRLIAAVVAVVGLGFVPFMDFFVKTEEEIPHLMLYYILILANTVVSYLWVYKSTLVSADQRYYILRLNRFVFEMVRQIFQIMILCFTHNYMLYLLIQIACTIGSNLSISLRADKLYPFLKNNKSKLPKTEQKRIFVSIKDVFLYRFGGTILNNTDNILISKIISTATVGLYSNYTLVSGSISIFINLFFSSLTGSIGNLNAAESRKESLKIYNQMSYISYWIYAFSAIALYSLLDDFVILWISPEFSVGKLAVFAICLDYYLSGITQVNAIFRDTTGLFKQTKFIYLYASVINIVLSIILGYKFGLGGIIVATSLSRICTTVWFQPYVIFKYFFRTSPRNYIKTQIGYLFITAAAYIPVHLFNGVVGPVNTISFAVKVVFTAIVPNAIILLLTFRTDEFKMLKERVIFIVNTKILKKTSKNEEEV